MKIKPTTPDGLRLVIVLLVITVLVLFAQNLHIMAAFGKVAHRVQRTAEGGK